MIGIDTNVLLRLWFDDDPWTKPRSPSRIARPSWTHDRGMRKLPGVKVL